MRSWNLLAMVRVGALAVLALALLAAPAMAYSSFGQCKSCHNNFRSGSPSIHDRHTSVVNSCFDCHESAWNSPATNSSGNYANYSCNGCHPKAGLATHHVNAGQTVCNDCHDDVIGTLAGEQVLPYFYTEGRSSLVNTCRRNAANGGEDLDGDGFGLDNDGDLLYDVDDSDCNGIVPTERRSWSTEKSRYNI